MEHLRILIIPDYLFSDTQYLYPFQVLTHWLVKTNFVPDETYEVVGLP